MDDVGAVKSVVYPLNEGLDQGLQDLIKDLLLLVRHV